MSSVISSDVLPRLPSDDMRYGLGGHPKVGGNMSVQLALQRPFADRLNSRYRQLVHSNSFTRGVIAAPLRFFVSVVVELSSKKQMHRIAALWIVTTMQGVQSFRNRAIREFPCIPVGLLTSVCAVPIRVRHSLPLPTVIDRRRAIDTFPEPLGIGKVSPKAYKETGPRAVLAYRAIFRERAAAGVTYANKVSRMGAHCGVSPTQTFRGVTLRMVPAMPELSYALIISRNELFGEQKGKPQ